MLNVNANHQKVKVKEMSGMFLHKSQANIIHWNLYFVFIQT